ncbi:MAG TPA: ATP-binding protein [Steroidobacteraceae bacterium]|nr:ATP-binding protein [Steroidobacteraceae bacterium]
MVFAFLSIVTTTITTTTLTSISSQRAQVGLRDRAARITGRLRLQLAPVVELNDQLAAREILRTYFGDRELEGIAVYGQNGELIEGQGRHPATLLAPAAAAGSDRNHVVATAEINSRDGRSGRLYLSFTTSMRDATHRRDILVAAGVGALIVICTLILAVQMSRRISGRLVRIAEAADRMARGDLSHVHVDDAARDEIGALSQSFNMMVTQLRRLHTEQERMTSTERERLEDLVSERTQALEQSREMFRLMAESTQAVPFMLDLTRGCFTYIGAQGVADSGLPESAWLRPGGLDAIMPRASNTEVRQRFDECEQGPFEFVAAYQRQGRRLEVRWTGTCEWVERSKILRGLMLDITELRRLGRELAAAQKLESVGRLAAGVAHEINTPVQFVSDNVQFVRGALPDIAKVIAAYRDLHRAATSGTDVAAAAAAAGAAEQAADLDYVMENLPLAIDSSIEGLGRIATIVRSMKEFAHPDQGEKKLVDLNQAIRSTLVIARNEYKYVAEAETHFGELPSVPCYLGEFNQVILNLLVNAAHAIGDVVKDSGDLGKLTIRTRLDGDAVEISISDTGTGIPESARDKIFDPFFTTKEVGKGTGQGLAIAHSVVVGKHGGALRFETEIGKGTTFFITLPLESSETEQVAA